MLEVRCCWLDIGDRWSNVGSQMLMVGWMIGSQMLVVGGWTSDVGY